MNAAAILMISQGIGEALRLGLLGHDLLRQLGEGSLTEAQALERWERAQGDYRAGRDAWDAAGDSGVPA